MSGKVDAIIVGAGAGGGVAAKVLACAGLKTVLFERGDWPDYSESPGDEMISQTSFKIRPLHGPDPKKCKCRGEIAAVVGSGTVTYGAMAWRFMPQDFRMKSTYGEIENSTLEDWPISYEDLAPFYEQAEYEIGVSGSTEGNPFAPPRKRDFPMPPFEFSREDMHFIRAEKRLGLHPFPIPMLRNSVPYNGRAACFRNRTCCGFVCPCDAKNGTQNTVIPAAMKTGNCEVRTNCVVSEIIMEGKRAVGVKYFDVEKDKWLEQRADIVVVAASAKQTARLLLNSANSDFRDGIGNHSDMVGRNLQDHSYPSRSGLFDFDIKEFLGPGATVAISDFNHPDDGSGRWAGIIATDFHKWPIGLADTRPPNSPRWGAEHKRFQREDYKKIKGLHCCIHQIPRSQARVVIDKTVKDFWGIPVYKTVGTKHRRDFANIKMAVEAMDKILIEAGAKKVWGFRPPDVIPAEGAPAGAGQHQAGTCRMGDDPSKSVCDAFCRVWNTDNLFLCDGSVHVTNGGFNPVLTIMALSYRTSAHIVEKFSKA